jgi:histidine triad (HIT) family protein|tara:strand:- start:228 stop:785 length:558 start_codon:yes stop_codon:yes gene_type:complete
MAEQQQMNPEELLKATKEQCIFCKIVSGEIPGYKVYEDEEVLALLDIRPVNAGHVLVIPKEHYIVLPQVPDDLAERLMLVVKYLSGAVFEMTGAHGINVIQNNGAASGQEVPHVHFHIIPRYEGDKAIGEWVRKDIKPEQLEELSKAMSSRLKPLPKGSTRVSVPVEEETPEEVESAKLKWDASP